MENKETTCEKCKTDWDKKVCECECHQPKDTKEECKHAVTIYTGYEYICEKCREEVKVTTKQSPEVITKIKQLDEKLK